MREFDRRRVEDSYFIGNYVNSDGERYRILYGMNTITGLHTHYHINRLNKNKCIGITSEELRDGWRCTKVANTAPLPRLVGKQIKNNISGKSYDVVGHDSDGIVIEYEVKHVAQKRIPIKNLRSRWEIL